MCRVPGGVDVKPSTPVAVNEYVTLTARAVATHRDIELRVFSLWRLLPVHCHREGRYWQGVRHDIKRGWAGSIFGGSKRGVSEVESRDAVSTRGR